MTMVENKLLRCKRAQTVPQQNVWLVRMFVLRDDPKRNHVFNELIKAAGAEFTKTARWFCGQPMSNLNDATNLVMTAPFHARNGKTVSTRKLESLELSHMSFTRD